MIGSWNCAATSAAAHAASAVQARTKLRNCVSNRGCAGCLVLLQRIERWFDACSKNCAVLLLVVTAGEHALQYLQHLVRIGVIQVVGINLCVT